MPKPLAGFVIQRCGADVYGGAELLCFELAKRLGTYWEIDVLTTRARDYMTWRDFYPEGHSVEDGVHLQRFSVDAPRNVRRFNKLSEQLRFDVAHADAQLCELWMREQGPRSSALRDYIGAHRFRYDAFFFFGYLYATTYELLPLVEEKAFLVPFAQQEWPIRMPIWDAFFEKPLALIFNTPEELEFVRARFAGRDLGGPIVGAGVDPPSYVDAANFARHFAIDEPFMLYLGRIDPSKGCDVLLDDFARARAQGKSPARLVMAGDVQMQIPAREGVSVVGPLSHAQKWEALAACAVLVMPSPRESLSLAVLEAWSMGKPVLVNAHSPVLVGQCRRSGGGLWYANYDEFEAALGVMNAPVRERLGMQGRAFVKATCSWEDAVRAYCALVGPQSSEFLEPSVR